MLRFFSQYILYTSTLLFIFLVGYFFFFFLCCHICKIYKMYLFNCSLYIDAGPYGLTHVPMNGGATSTIHGRTVNGCKISGCEDAHSLYCVTHFGRG